MRISDPQTGKSYRPEDMLQDVADGLSSGLLTKDEALQKIVTLAGGDPHQLEALAGDVGIELSTAEVGHYVGLKPPASN